MKTATANTAMASELPERRLITMAAIIALAVIAIIALVVLGFAVHLLFSPWLLLLVIAILVWVKFRPRGTR